MKKTLLSLFAVALAANIQAADPTLLSVFEHTTDMPTAGDTRFGTGFGGKVFTVDKANKQVIAWDENGKSVYAQDDSFIGVAITRDDAGNILVSNGFNNAASATNWSIISATNKSIHQFTLELPSGVSAARFDQIGRVVGNVLSDEGGYMYITPNGQSATAVVKIVNGVQDKEHSYVSSSMPSNHDTGTLAQPSLSTIAEIETAENPGNTFYWRKRNANSHVFMEMINNTWTKSSVPSEVTLYSTNGFDVFTMGGVRYAIYPTYINSNKIYTPSFAIYDIDNKKVVATRDVKLETKTSENQALIAEKVSDNTYNIYQYLSGWGVAMFVFTTDSDVITGVEETMVDANAAVEYYNLQGVKVANPENGLFIKKQGSKTTKVVL